MKKNRFVGRGARFFLAVTFITATLFSCKESDGDLVKPITITDVILKNQQFSILRDIMLVAKMGDSMRTENYTIFAPNNAAFEKSRIFSSAVITSKGPDSARIFIQNHIVKGRVGFSDLKVQNYPTASLKSVSVTKTDSTFFVNGSEITRVDVKADNGLIHIIDKVITIK
jgi:uncharacterized surface protein with fasciclin (FAS1) repeats